jgi:hypothetical protein
MAVPYIRNPNRAGRVQNAKTSNSNYHHELAYYRVGRRTKGFVYTSGAASRSGNGDGDAAGVVVGVIAFIVVVTALCCFIKMDRKRRQNRRDIRSTRNLVHQRRSMRNLHATNTVTTNAYPLQFHTQEQQANESPNTYQNPSDMPVRDRTITPVSMAYMPSRHEKMLQNFNFQTVLPDKSNVTASALLEEQCDTASDDDSVIEKPNQDRHTMNKGTSYKLSSRFLMSTWRRPTENDECSICLHGYDAGQTVCVSKTSLCDHIFHQDCIKEWLKDHDNCPMCRVNLMYSAPN